MCNDRNNYLQQQKQKCGVMVQSLEYFSCYNKIVQLVDQNSSDVTG